MRLIDADRLKAVLEKNFGHTGGASVLEQLIDEQPTAQPEPHEGHWINGKCNLCGEHAPFWAMASTYHESNYCPNCGAKMKGEPMTDTERERINAICKVAGVTEIDDLSDGFHTFRQLYYQRMMLFATIVKQNKDKAWKSLRHEDGELCFGGGWFIVGIDTPEGSYTYHYENKYFDLFDCEILDYGKHWDGHTEKDVTRLLSLPKAQLSKEDTTSDLISRQAAIDAVEKNACNTQRIIDAVNNLPPAQPEPQWIPVSERLPEVHESGNSVSGIYMQSNPVLVYGTCEYEDNAQFHVVTYCDDLDGNTYWSTELDAITVNGVLAWMPLPEAYKPNK